MSIIQAPLALSPSSTLKGSWTSRAVAGSVRDQSGNGKHGTMITGACWERHPFFGDEMHTAGNESGFSFPCSLGLTTQGTWIVWHRCSTLVAAGGLAILCVGANGGSNFGFSTNGTLEVWGSLRLDAVQRTLTDAESAPARVGVDTMFAMSYDGDKIRLYRDNILTEESASLGGALSDWNGGTGKFGAWSGATIPFNGRLIPLGIWSTALSSSEMGTIYDMARRACFKTDWGYWISTAAEGGVAGGRLSNTPLRTADATGRYTITTDTIDGTTVKVVSCSTAGELELKRFQMKHTAGAASFGEWSGYFYRAAGTAITFAYITENGTTSRKGYSLSCDANGAMSLLRTNAVGGTEATLLTTANGAIPASEWCKVSIRRRIDGQFTVYVDDVAVTAATGSNPATDTTNIAASGWIIGLGVGCKVSLASGIGHYALTKYLKG